MRRRVDGTGPQGTVPGPSGRVDGTGPQGTVPGPSGPEGRYRAPGAGGGHEPSAFSHRQPSQSTLSLEVRGVPWSGSVGRLRPDGLLACWPVSVLAC